VTASRWWVQLFARWQARIDSVKGQIQAMSLAVTAFSTFSLLLQNSGHGEWVRPLGAVLAIAGPAYAYLYFEGGVWNQVARDRSDMSSNFAAPSQRIEKELGAAGLAAALKGEPLTAEERAALSTEIDRAFRDLRDGVDVEECLRDDGPSENGTHPQEAPDARQH